MLLEEAAGRVWEAAARQTLAVRVAAGAAVPELRAVPAAREEAIMESRVMVVTLPAVVVVAAAGTGQPDKEDMVVILHG